MSSWKKAAKAGQKTHRERHQPESRQHLGLLEKKKDYKLRAQDYNEKQATLKLLKKRALNKNPDEFYFHMINSKMDKGVHREKEKKEEHTIDQIRLMETQDLKYISHKRHLEARQIEKLQSQLHMIDVANQTPNNHIFFVDDDEEAKNFDVAKRLETHPALLSRKTNRPKLSALKKVKLPELDEATIAKVEQQKHMAYTELRKRIERETGLTIVQQKLEMRRALKDRTLDKPKVIKQGSKTSAPVYKWKLQRKK
ncbi:probable U3 small nucleolar RNA-associated protein 11 [Microplitis demolitor]|uniref:probable U3 small nucleolar RNA-associated protein 11 n=1 Tax=Microplitis demolitor TaxID=69319 RepID=UPI0004CD5D71|nr:probable U3 small nucleolar RNA-associated protein 11 [Microplitis demolitor]